MAVNRPQKPAGAGAPDPRKPRKVTKAEKKAAMPPAAPMVDRVMHMVRQSVEARRLALPVDPAVVARILKTPETHGQLLFRAAPSMDADRKGPPRTLVYLYHPEKETPSLTLYIENDRIVGFRRLLRLERWAAILTYDAPQSMPFRDEVERILNFPHGCELLAGENRRMVHDLHSDLMIPATYERGSRLVPHGCFWIGPGECVLEPQKLLAAEGVNRTAALFLFDLMTNTDECKHKVPYGGVATQNLHPVALRSFLNGVLGPKVHRHSHWIAWLIGNPGREGEINFADVALQLAAHRVEIREWHLNSQVRRHLYFSAHEGQVFDLLVPGET